MSTLKLSMLIKELNRVDTHRVPYDHLVQRMWAASVGRSAPIGGSAAELYFRARKMTIRPHQVDELGMPPSHLVNGFQRCNGPGQPMFYAASKRITALLEARVAAGDVVYLSHWVGQEAMRVNRIIHDPAPSSSPEDNMFYSYLDTLFTRRIHETFSDDYKLTAAATKMLSTSMRLSPEAPDECVGLAFASVANRFDGYNTVFHPASAARLKLLHVTELRVTRQDEFTDEVEIELLDNANAFEGGAIRWLDDANAIPAPLGIDRSTLVLEANAVDWVLPLRQTAVDRVAIQEFLRE